MNAARMYYHHFEKKLWSVFNIIASTCLTTHYLYLNLMIYFTTISIFLSWWAQLKTVLIYNNPYSIDSPLIPSYVPSG